VRRESLKHAVVAARVRENHAMPQGEPTPIGYYTAAEVGRLAGVSPHRVGQWARHRIILPSVSRKPNIYSYADAGESILAHYLVKEGKRPRDVRLMVHRLREEFGPWPLARAPLEHEGQMVVIRRDDGLYDVAFPQDRKVISGTFVDLRKIRHALGYGGWVALERERKHIEVDPDRHSGDPVIRGRRLSTGRVAALAKEPGGRKVLKEDFGLTNAEISDAVGYEDDVAALAA
jgi:uncharacterized protein (DUF433 family)